MLSPDFIIGREKELQTIIAHIMDRKNLYIYGHEGAGKSVLLDWVYNKFKELDNALIPIYCRNSRTLREIVLQTAGFLLDHFKRLKSIDKFKNVKKIENPADIRKLDIRAIKNIVFAYITRGNFCVILDHLEYVTPRINSLLTALYERVPVITASRQSWEITDYSFRGRLDYCLYLTPKLRIENLERKDAFALMERLCSNLNIDFSWRPRMLEEIFRISRGNPKIILEVLEKAGRPEYLTDNRLNLKLILIDCKMEKLNP